MTLPQLDWLGDRFCQLATSDGRTVDLRFWNRFKYRHPPLCLSCDHPHSEHEFASPFTPDAMSRCCYGNAGIHCNCSGWEQPPRPGLTLETELRFYGLVRVKNGDGKGGRRARWKLAVVRGGFTVTRVCLYSMPFGSLLQCVGNGADLRLTPPRKHLRHGGAVLPGAELGRLAVAIDIALERGDWAPEVGSRPSPTHESSQGVLL